jgi:hypothetical protein
MWEDELIARSHCHWRAMLLFIPGGSIEGAPLSRESLLGMVDLLGDSLFGESVLHRQSRFYRFDT